ncbi:MAG: hypothetical protein AAF558_08740, partial [Verrucomicrobiota bacterium]
SDLVSETPLGEVNIKHPPEGAWYQRQGRGIVVGATHFSPGTAIGALAISLFWNGIVSVFVLVAISGTINLLGISIPEWFPAPEMNNQTMGVGMVIFLWVFLTPFIVIGSVMIGAFVMSLGGKTEIRIERGFGVLFQGIGPLGWKKKFQPDRIKQVKLPDKNWVDSDGDAQHHRQILIHFDDGKEIKLGSTLTAERRIFLAGALKQTLSLLT